MTLLAQIPYGINKSYDFYSDRLISDDKEILYRDMAGYGYSLTNSSFSLNFLPIVNSTGYSFRIYTDHNSFNFSKTGSNLMNFKNKKQKAMNIIFGEIVKCTDAILLPQILEGSLNNYRLGNPINLGTLTCVNGMLIKKTTFGQKELNLSDYGQTVLAAGRVKIMNKRGEPFYICSLDEFNAPLIGNILDNLTLDQD